MTISLANAQLNTLAIVGNGTTQGWPNDPQTDAHQLSSSDGINWTIENFTLLNGAIKFRGNNAWALPYNWGGTSFPAGTATIDGPGITATPGIYNITFNSNTGVYNFEVQDSGFPVIGIIGSATAGGWETDTVMTTIDGVNYSLNRVVVVAGAIKFRQDLTWTPTTNWGGNDFPSGVGTLDGAAITIPSNGTYNITFNRNTAAYNFYFPTVALVGAGAGGWPNDPQTDANQLNTENGVNYTLNTVTLTADNAKFRANNSWAINWGATTFPSGTGILDSQDSFLCVAGAYSVTFNYDTGAYNFDVPLSTHSFNVTEVKVYPNPTSSLWNFSTVTEAIENIQIIDLSGKIVLTVSTKSNLVSVDATALNAGLYFARISTATSTSITKLFKK